MALYRDAFCTDRIPPPNKCVFKRKHIALSRIPYVYFVLLLPQHSQVLEPHGRLKPSVSVALSIGALLPIKIARLIPYLSFTPDLLSETFEMLQTRLLLTVHGQVIYFRMPVDLKLARSHDEELFRLIILIEHNLVPRVSLAARFLNQL